MLLPVLIREAFAMKGAKCKDAWLLKVQKISKSRVL